MTHHHEPLRDANGKPVVYGYEELGTWRQDRIWFYKCIGCKVEFGTGDKLT